MPKELKKYNRPTKVTSDAIPTTLVQRAVTLTAVIANPNNIAEIAKEMSDCFPFHQLLLKEKKSFAEILQTFPHFASFNGRLVSITVFTLSIKSLGPPRQKYDIFYLRPTLLKSIVRDLGVNTTMNLPANPNGDPHF